MQEWDPRRLHKDGEKGIHKEVARGLEEADEGGVLETSGGSFMKEKVKLKQVHGGSY